MKKILKTLLVASVLITFWGCGGGKYDDAIEVNKDFIKITESYIQDLEDSNSSKDIVKAMENYSEQFKKLAPEMQKIKDKYPDMMTNSKIPEELKEMNKKAQQVGTKLAGSFMKIMKYMTDPEVVEAQKNMAEAMQGK